MVSWHWWQNMVPPSMNAAGALRLFPCGRRGRSRSGFNLWFEADSEIGHARGLQDGLRPLPHLVAQRPDGTAARLAGDRGKQAVARGQGAVHCHERRVRALRPPRVLATEKPPEAPRDISTMPARASSLMSLARYDGETPMASATARVKAGCPRAAAKAMACRAAFAPSEMASHRSHPRSPLPAQSAAPSDSPCHAQSGYRSRISCM